MGPGGPDLLTRMPWFRQVTAKHPMLGWSQTEPVIR